MSDQPASDTPRTDGQCLSWNLSDRELQKAVEGKRLGHNGHDIQGKVVLADFARTLERELAALTAENARLQAELKRSKRNEAVCHCGQLISAHTMGDGHSPIPSPELCSYAEDVIQLKADLARSNEERERLERYLALNKEGWKETEQDLDEARRKLAVAEKERDKRQEDSDTFHALDELVWAHSMEGDDAYEVEDVLASQLKSLTALRERAERAETSFANLQVLVKRGEALEAQVTALQAQAAKLAEALAEIEAELTEVMAEDIAEGANPSLRINHRLNSVRNVLRSYRASLQPQKTQP